MIDAIEPAPTSTPVVPIRITPEQVAKINAAMITAVKAWKKVLSLDSTESDEMVSERISIIRDLVSGALEVLDTPEMKREYTFYRCVPSTKAKVDDKPQETTKDKPEEQTEKGIDVDITPLPSTRTIHAEERHYPSAHAINTTSYVTFVEQDPELLIWLPDSTLEKEIVLLLRMSLGDNAHTTETLPRVVSSIEAGLTSFCTAAYQAAKDRFASLCSTQIPTLELAHTCEWLIYYESWEKLVGETVFIGDARWEDWLLSKKTVELDALKYDYLVATYLTALMYLARQDNDDALERLIDALHPVIGAKEDAPLNTNALQLKPSRGPVICIGPEMFRTRCAIARALTYWPHIQKKKHVTLYEKIKTAYQKAQGILKDLKPPEATDNNLKSVHQARLLAARCNVIELEARRLKKARLQDEDKAESLRRLIADTHALMDKIQPLLQQALRQPPAAGTTTSRIELSSRWLDAWLGVKLIQEDVLPGKTDAKTPPTDLRAKLLTYDSAWLAEIIECWANYYYYLLTYFVLPELSRTDHNKMPELPTAPEDDLADHARLKLLCEWAHKRGVPRALPIEKWLTDTYESELALYALSGKGTHRQHLFHVQDECLLGCVLLYSEWKGHSENYLKRIANPDGESKQDREDLLLCNWFVAALLHDIGYALKVVPQGLDGLSESMVKGLGTLVDDIKGRLSQAPHTVGDYDPTPTRASAHLEVGDHAHVSMATVLSHLRELNDQWQTAMNYNAAAAAIINHDSKDTCIDYAADPLSALIVLCDQLQDWGRPRLDASALAHRFLGSLRRLSNSQPESMQIQQLASSSHLYVDATLDDSCNLVHEPVGGSDTIRLILDSEQAGEGGYEPAVAWMDVCRALQCIELPRRRLPKVQLLPTIQVVLQHRIAKDGIPELHRLSRFANDDPERCGAILDWLTNVREQEARSDTQSIKYGCDEKAYQGFLEKPPDDNAERHNAAHYEWIEFIIPTLNNGGRPPLKQLPGKLYRSYRKARKDAEAS